MTDQNTFTASAFTAATSPIMADPNAASLLMMLIEKPQALAPMLAVFLIFVLIRGQNEQSKSMSRSTEKISELIDKVSDLTSKLAVLVDRTDRH